MRKVPRFLLGVVCLALLLASAACPARASDTTNALSWRAKQNQVDAEIQKWPLPKLLKKIAAVTGWKVYVEPGTTATVSTKFKNLPEDEALRRLLGKLNYFRDETNGVSRLFVFRTASKAATQAVQAEPKKDYRIPNELLVKLKNNPTNSIDQLAKQLGAKIISRDDKLGLYRLQFADGSTTDAALQSLASDPLVAAVDSNYSVDRPAPVQFSQAGPAAAGPAFNLNPPVVNGPIVGLVDTSVDPPSEFQKYMLTPVSVVGTSEEPGDQPTHGTGMLETVLGAMAANPSMVLPVDVYGNGESTTTYDVMEGIVDAVNAGANPINLSLGGTGNSQMLGSLIEEAEQKGIEFVAASGNTPGTEDTYPAAYPGVLAVTASAANGQLASYADDGGFVKAMEPGTAPVIWDGQEWIITGTSTATATMTGAITSLENQDHITAQQAAAKLILIYPPPR
jgi:thermitase